jgi:protein gp37
MAANSKIEWTHHSFNPVWGCHKVSPGCDNCYAETFSKRVGQKVWGPPALTERRTFGDAHWAEPLKWDRDAAAAGERRRVFCASMADVFEAHRTVDAARDRLWGLIAATPNLDWLLLTKRPERIAGRLPWEAYEDARPWPNVWLGTSVESQEYAGRLDFLLAVPAAVHFVSAEPLLGPLDLRRYLRPRTVTTFPVGAFGAARVWSIPALSWVIAGGESGPRHRPLDVDWARGLRDQCQDSGVAFHFKQIGGLHHAAGGQKDMFQRLRAAYEQALGEVKP